MEGSMNRAMVTLSNLGKNGSAFCVARMRAIVSLIAITSLVLACFHPGLGSAHPSDTLADGYAFTTAASGLLPTGSRDLLIGSFQTTLDEDDRADDPGAGTAGFIVVATGEVLVSSSDRGLLAVLQEGEALYVTAEENLALLARNDDATIWRLGVTAWQSGDDLPSDVDAQISGDVDASDDAVREVSFRTGVVPEGVAANMGEEGEQTPLLYALSGAISIVDGGTIDDGDMGIGIGGSVQATDGDAFVGYMAIGATFSFDEETGKIDVQPSANSDSTGGKTSTDTGSGDSTGGNTGPAPTPTATVDLTDLDSDGDGLNDQFEMDAGTDPLKADTDGDGLTDRQELIELDLDTDPLNPDSDNDGLTDGEELNNGVFVTDPFNGDTDADFLPDGFEVNVVGSNPVNPDTDGDGLRDNDELAVGSDPNVPDTDGDGVLDATEVAFGSSTLVPDTDSDGLLDIQEMNLGSNPQVADTDNDGFADGLEFANGTSPIDPNSH
jgi:Bacterial TSP3 repeat